MLLNVTTLVPVDDKPDNALVAPNCNVAVDAGAMAKVDVLVDVFEVLITPVRSVVPPVTLNVAPKSDEPLLDEVSEIFPDTFKFVTDEAIVPV